CARVGEDKMISVVDIKMSGYFEFW
nr:immunoglobulin heavy chain junction region [Macaca mulatta]MOV88647.1 immunoglobulin heavy chain junction region [Macaca mulatta]MOV88702.1 immunoglobulin heavy chain junction region [Macaca mulatta]MOV89034.1 immunoglobulin heavy chain junction region [Macaca mulatta]MOV89382.1 immunoglobulin heavy chain junction region [Macaca mulatta]